MDEGESEAREEQKTARLRQNRGGNKYINLLYFFLTDSSEQVGMAGEMGRGEGERERAKDGGKGGSLGDCVMTLMKALNPQRTL